MPKFDPQLIKVPRSALEEVMTRIPLTICNLGDKSASCRVYLGGRCPMADKI